jgi:hypothetical protein
MSLLNKQNYKQLSDIINIAWEDLEDIGITRLGHQKRFMLGVKRLIDIDKGLYQPNPNKKQIKYCNSLENNEFSDSLTYATLRKPQISSNSLMNKHRTGTYIPTSSFRLPPPLSSPIINCQSTRTRSLENINSNERKLDVLPVSSQYSTMINLDDTNLSSSTESTNGIPFANENIGTIKQRSPLNNYNTIDTMKRSLPIEFFQQSNTTTMPIYDNNERFTRQNIDKRSQYIEVFKKDKQIK